MSLAGGLLLALASTAALNWGWVAQHGAAAALPPLRLRRPLASLRSLLAARSWLAGFLVGLLGWALYAAALVLAPLSLVQAVSAGGIGLLAALARRRGEHVSRGRWGAVALSMLGLLLLGVSLTGGAAPAAAPGWAPLAGWLLISAAIATLASAGTPWSAAGAPLGIAAGSLYAAGDVATKAAAFGGGRLALVPVVLALHGAAFVALQLAFQRGGALATAGTATLLTNALPIAAGVLVFSEHLPGGALGVVRLAAFACVVAGAGALARREGDTAARPAAGILHPDAVS